MSISLDDIFTKAYFNRAIARARQGKLEDAIEGTCTCHVATLTTLPVNNVYRVDQMISLSIIIQITNQYLNLSLDTSKQMHT